MANAVETVVVVAGGPRPHPGVVAALPPGAEVIAADRGAAHALALGLTVALAVGDFDSIDRDTLAALERSGARIESHPASKDATDLELALRAAAARSPRRVVVVGSGGGRLDHLLGGLELLGSDEFAAFELDALLGRACVHVVRGERRFEGRVRELVSLVPLRGDARGVVSEGLVYALHGELLAAGSSRGISNIFAEPDARVALEEGLLLVVRPGTRVTPAVFKAARHSVTAGSASS